MQINKSLLNYLMTGFFKIKTTELTNNIAQI